MEKLVESEVWETREEERVNVMEEWEVRGLGIGFVGRVLELGKEGG